MKLTVFDHNTEKMKSHEGDEEGLRAWLAEHYNWLNIQPGEPLHDIVDDLNSNQFLEAHLDDGLSKSEDGDEDGIHSLLQLDDPIERKLALKSRHVEPFHLREALQDEDPEVRLAAAHHPGLPAPLIVETLRGQDRWLAEQILTRPDLRSEELEVVMDEPELWPWLVKHPALTPNQRHRIVTDERCPEELKLEIHLDKSEIESWVANLKKNDSFEPESIQVEDHLGLDMAMLSYIEAAKFLTGKDVPLQEVRKALWRCDGDIRMAVGEAFGLDTDDRRKALDAVLSIRDVKKSSPKPPSNILALLPSGEDVVEDIKDAFVSGDVSPVTLGGRHSKGAMIARDDDGVLWLLKPGSGNQSPAAGAKQQDASQSRREAAFSAIAKDWGLGSSVPRAEVLAIDGKEVAALRMLPLSWQNLSRSAKLDANLPRRVLEPLRERGTLHRWAVMDWVLGNPDRHGQNLMVSSAADGHRVALIDHGSAFAGTEFDPGHDENSFVPYYLRIWVPDFQNLGGPGRKRHMPTVSPSTDSALREWVMDLDEGKLASSLSRHGVDPSATVARLQKMKEALTHTSDKASGIINGFWVS